MHKWPSSFARACLHKEWLDGSAPACGLHNALCAVVLSVASSEEEFFFSTFRTLTR